MKEGMKLLKEEKQELTKILKKTNCLPPTQGKVILNISPEGSVSTVEVRFMK